MWYVGLFASSRETSQEEQEQHWPPLRVIGLQEVLAPALPQKDTMCQPSLCLCAQKKFSMFVCPFGWLHNLSFRDRPCSGPCSVSFCNPSLGTEPDDASIKGNTFRTRPNRVHGRKVLYLGLNTMALLLLHISEHVLLFGPLDFESHLITSMVDVTAR